MSEYSDSSALINGAIQGINSANVSVLRDEFGRVIRQHTKEKDQLKQQIKQKDGEVSAYANLNAVSQGKLRNQEALTSSLEQENKQLKTQNNALQDEQKEYEELLAKPLRQIIDEHTDLKKAYEKQQEILNNWIVSQKAFKELVYEYSASLNKSDTDVEQDYKQMEKAVRYKQTMSKK